MSVVKYLKVKRQVDEGVELVWDGDYLTIWMPVAFDGEAKHFTLKEFFKEMGITEKDCMKAFEAVERGKSR